MGRLCALIAAAVAAATLAATPAFAIDDASLARVDGDFDAPVYVTAPPGDTRRLLVVEQTGRVQLVLDGAEQGTPFLDLSRLVSSGGERGLLSVAFDPDYASSGLLYAYSTDTAGNIRIDEFHRGGNANQIDAGTRRLVLAIAHPTNANHNGGQLQYPQGDSLYAGTGDGGSGDDPPGNAQNPFSRLGKLLRIQPATGAVETWSSGLRNPWRWSFDRSTGDVVIGDVGQGAREEVDVATRGSGDGRGTNWGWRCWEGTRRNTDVSPSCDPPGDVAPVLEQTHADGWCAITGGYVVRDPTVPRLAGRYVYGDYCKQEIRTAALVAPPGRVGDDRPVSFSGAPVSLAALSSFGEDAGGCVYAVSQSDRAVYRIAPPGGGATCPNAALAPSPGPDLSLAAPPGGVGGGAAPGAGGGPGAGAGGGGAVVDLRTVAKRRQRVLRQRGRVRIGVRCSAACTIRTRGTVAVARVRKTATLRLARATRKLPARRRTTLALRLKGSTLRAVRRAFKRKRTALATVTVSARDAAGGHDTTRRRVRLIR